MPQPSTLNHDLITAQVLLQHFFPDRPPLQADNVQVLLNTAGLWALTTHIAAPPERSDLLTRLGQRLQAGHPTTQLPQDIPMPPLPAPDEAPLTGLQAVQAQCHALRQPFASRGRIPEAVRHLSYRTTPAFLDRAIATLPAEVSHVDLHVTLLLTYFSWSEVQARVHQVLHLRATRHAEHPQVVQDPEAVQIAAVLASHGLPWATGSTLRGAVKQVAMRVSQTLAITVLGTLPKGPNVTQQDLHTTLLALYLADDPFQQQVRALLIARRGHPSRH